MGKKEAYQEKIDAQLRIWSAEIQKLRAKADRSKAEAKIGYFKQIEELGRKEKAARRKLEELKEAGADTWEEARTGVERLWKDLKESLEDTLAALKGK